MTIIKTTTTWLMLALGAAGVCVGLALAVGLLLGTAEGQSASNNSGPRIDRTDTVPPVYGPTGCEVMWNDQEKVIEHLLTDAHFKHWHTPAAAMPRPAVKFEGDGRHGYLHLGGGDLV